MEIKFDVTRTQVIYSVLAGWVFYAIAVFLSFISEGSVGVELQEPLWFYIFWLAIVTLLTIPYLGFMENYSELLPLIVPWVFVIVVVKFTENPLESLLWFGVLGAWFGWFWDR